MELDDLLKKLPETTSPADRELVGRAYKVADRAHAGQKRLSGEKYVQHCLAVADILADLKAPPPVLAAGLLHDTVEDTSVKLEDIRRDFGPEVTTLVDGVTKLDELPRVSRGSSRTKADSQRAELAKETLRKTFLAMGDDVRVVVIKLADRLHNMRTLSYLPVEKRERIALETLEIFAPLANRLGIWQMKWELEDLSFRYVIPDKYKEIAGLVAERRADRQHDMETITARLREELSKAGIEAEVKGRPKHLYSIYRKMERKQVPFELVYDVRGVRVLVANRVRLLPGAGRHPQPVEADSRAPSTTTSPPPRTISISRCTRRSIFDDGRTVEVQIRTPGMEESAEFGIAAHWRYKEGRKRDRGFEQRINWLRRLMEWRQDVDNATDFVDAMKSEVFNDRVYVFTPRGDIIDLPAGSTPIDFAYHIHTDIGHRCRGAKVNGRLVNLDAKLQTGEAVEILTAKRGGPSRDWLNSSLEMVRTQRAISKIRQWFKREDREQNVSDGRQTLEREMRRLGLEGVAYERIARDLGFGQVEDLLAAIGCGDVNLGKVVSRLAEAKLPELDLPRPLDLEARRAAAWRRKRSRSWGCRVC